MRKLVATLLLTSSLAGAVHAETLQVPYDVSAGHMNIRTGPGANYDLIGSIPAGTTITWHGPATCVPRQDGIAGADWCRVNTRNGMLAPLGDRGNGSGWVSRAGLMPVQDQPPSYPDGEPPVSPDYQSKVADLVCGRSTVLVGQEGYDPNPVVSTEVTYIPAEHSWRIFHHLADGGTVSRSEQYSIVDKSDEGRVQWFGSLVQNRAVVMTGELRMDHGHPIYIEWLQNRNHGMRVEMNSKASCRKTADLS